MMRTFLFIEILPSDVNFSTQNGAPWRQIVAWFRLLKLAQGYEIQWLLKPLEPVERVRRKSEKRAILSERSEFNCELIFSEWANGLRWKRSGFSGRISLVRFFRALKEMNKKNRGRPPRSTPYSCLVVPRGIEPLGFITSSQLWPDRTARM